MLVDQATKFVSDLILFSEPFGSTAVLPTPELKGFEPDYDMMWRSAADGGDSSDGES
jgi:hypothetical protein